MNKTISLLLTLALIGATSLLTSCNTVRGVGQDIENAGHAIESSAE